MRKFLRRIVHDKSGAIMVEGAFGILACLFAFFWMLEFGVSLYDQSDLSQAAKTGVQYAIVHGTVADADCVASNGIGCGSGPGAAFDPTGSREIVPLVEAAMAQSALKRSVKEISVCPAWWPVGSTVPSSVYNPSSCSTSLNPSYRSTGTAAPGNTVTIQVVWKYVPYIPVPWTTPTYSYTATGVVAY